jgi:hypothetical protein
MCSWFKHGGFAFDYLMQLWRVPGCRACSICLADKAADVTLADPWGLLQEATDDLGCNLVFAWTQKGVELLAQAEPVLTLFPASPEEALTSIDPRSIRYKNLYEIPCFLGQEPRFSRRFEYAVNGVKRAWLEFCIPFLPARLIRFPFGILRLLRLLSLPFSRLFSFSYRALRFIKRRLKRILLRSPA